MQKYKIIYFLKRVPNSGNNTVSSTRHLDADSPVFSRSATRRDHFTTQKTAKKLSLFQNYLDRNATQCLNVQALPGLPIDEPITQAHCPINVFHHGYDASRQSKQPIKKSVMSHTRSCEISFASLAHRAPEKVSN